MHSEDFIPCVLPQLDLFTKKPLQACITGRLVEKLQPISSLSERVEVIEFSSPGRALHYLDLNNVTIRALIRLRKKSDKGNLAAGDKNKISVVDCTLHSLFSSAEVFLSETPVTRHPQLYSYKAVFDLYSTAGADARAGLLATIPVLPDTADAANPDNDGKKARGEPYAESKPVELIGKLRTDCCQMDGGLYILDNVPLRVRLGVQSQDFVLWSTEPNVELIFQEVELLVPYYVGNAEMGIGLEMALSKQPASYRFKGSQLKTFIHPQNSANLEIPIAFNGRLPTRIMFAMVKSADFNGNMATNPYCFVNEGLQELSFIYNGKEKRLKMNFDNPMHCSSVYRSLYRSLGQELEELGPGSCFSLPMLRKGRFVCSADLTVDHSGNGPSQNLDQYGSVRITGRFKRAPADTLIILLYAQYDTTLEISSSREVNLV